MNPHSPIFVSIITVSYNSVATLADCLDSVSAQNYTSREHIVIDGASSDGTLGLLKRHSDLGFKYLSEPDYGIYDAMNKGIGCSRGDVIGFLQSDDVFASSDVLTKIAATFEDPSVCAVFGDLEYVNKVDMKLVVRKWTSRSFKDGDLEWGWMPPHPTLYVRRSWYASIQGFDSSFKISADYLSILNFFSRREFVSKYIPLVLVKMRLGGASNRSIGSVIRKTCEDWRALRMSKFSCLCSLKAVIGKNLRKIVQFL